MKKTKKINKLTNKRKKFSRRKRNIKKRHSKKYKGGVNLDISNIPDVIPILHNYSTIYIAIGAKFIKDNYPIPLNTGPYQLAPQFILDEASKDLEYKTLIIVIDLFNEEEYRISNNSIKSNLEDMEVLSNVDYIFVNNLFDETICDQIKNLITELEPKQNIYIADYVYYFSPNPNDINNEKKLDKLLGELLELLILQFGFSNSKDLPINKNIYKWLGTIEPNYISKFYLYGLIYSSWREAKLRKNQKQIGRFIENSLRITPDYGPFIY
jgi:hypothetical protein